MSERSLPLKIFPRAISWGIGRHNAKRYTALRDVIVREARNFTRKAVDVFRGRQIVQGDEVEEFWALKDVISRSSRARSSASSAATAPAKARCSRFSAASPSRRRDELRLRGRVASLLEVGTGFHPELTGRENIFLNGAILGMTRGEIRAKFDEIVAFAEVERFLDTPVKRYSSGMYVRLAFAVAAHLEPEILIVDEVLAVGEREFQKKCFGKMNDVAREGRTVLFVSHNMSAVMQLTKRAIVLSKGAVDFIGSSTDAVEKIYSRFARQYSNSI